MAERRRDWNQIAVDFDQKYVGTFCRYVSPIDKKKAIFLVTSVTANGKPPDITLFNPECGEIYLTYDTDTDLDFTFPESGYFQHGRFAYRFQRFFKRQWKKGVCDATAKVEWPYSDRLYRAHIPPMDYTTLESAFQNRQLISLKDATEKLKSENLLSVALNKSFALGLGKKQGTNWLWFEDEPIGEVNEEGINLSTPIFRQELDDYMRDSKHYVRVIQNIRA